MSTNIIHNAFHEAQKSQKVHKVNTNKMQSLLTGARAGDAFVVICQCYDKILSCSKKEAAAELTVKFFVSLVASATEDVFSSFVKYLLDRSNSLDKIVRFRSCQTISCIFKEFSEDSEIDNDLWNTLSDTLLPRLRDKCPNVRMWSLKALKDLQDPSNPGDPIFQEFVRLLQSDTSKDVRMTAIECILVTKVSLSHIIDRLGDVKMEVRLTATQKLVDIVDINHLTQRQRGTVIKYCLNDREEAVREKALELVVKWLHSPAVDKNVSKLLYLIGLVGNAAESELTAWSLIEAGTMNKEFTIENKTVTLKNSVEHDIMNWNLSFTQIPASELLWILLRCDFYFKSLSADRYLERVEQFLPDTVILCELLQEGHTLLRDEDCPQQNELTMELLLRITAFVDTCDVAGSKALISTCKDMVKDLKFLETLVEPVLDACCKAMTAVGANIGEDMSELSQELWPSVFDSEASEDNPFQPKNLDIDLAQLRSLQVAAWTIQNQTVNKSSPTAEGSPVEAFIPMVLQSLQQPIKDLRSAALRCLGLLGISSEKHCESFAGIVLQVASANQEDSFIRCQAIESLTDMAMVHSDELISQDTLVTLLVRMVDCGMPLIQRIAAEASAKLLFSGRIVKSPALLARLVRLYFSPIDTDDTESEGYVNFSNPQAKKCEASKGSEVYLDQLLSIFFPAFFSAGGDRGSVIVDSVVHLISNCAMHVRDGISTTMPLQKITEQLLSWCEYIPPSEENSDKDIADTTRQKLKARLCSVCFKEILTLDGSSPSSKLLLKDLSKLFAVLTPCDWVTSARMAQSILKVCRFVKSQCMLDKVSSKHLSTFYKACQECLKQLPQKQDQNQNQSVNDDEEEQEANEDEDEDVGGDRDDEDVSISGVVVVEEEDILTFAPGLAAMVAGWSADEDDERDISMHEDGEDYHDHTVDEESGTGGLVALVPARARIARVSKKQAQSRISEQLYDENIRNSNGKSVVVSRKVAAPSSDAVLEDEEEEEVQESL